MRLETLFSYIVGVLVVLEAIRVRMMYLGRVMRRANDIRVLISWYRSR